MGCRFIDNRNWVIKIINFGYAYMSYYDNFCNNRVIPCISTSIFCRVAKRADQELAYSKHPINDVRKRYFQNYISYMPNWPLRDHLSNSIVAVLQENISQKLKNCRQKKKKKLHPRHPLPIQSKIVPIVWRWFNHPKGA